MDWFNRNRYSSFKQWMLSIDFTLILTTITVLLACKVILSWIISLKKRPPGPIGLPLVGYLPFLGPEPYKTLLEMKKKYGELIGIYFGPQYTVILNDFKVAKEVLTHSAALDRDSKLFSHLPACGILTANGQPWMEQRRFCMSSARDLGLGKGQWETFIFEEVSNFVKILEGTQGQPTDIAHNIGMSIASNILSLLIGRHLSKDEESKIQLSVTYSDMSLQYTGPVNVATLVPRLRKVFEFFKVAGYDKAAEITRRFFHFLNEEVSRHKESSNFQKDFIQLYLDKWAELKKSQKKEHYFSDEMLLGNLNILFLGSSDTIFHSMLWTMRLMAKYPLMQSKVYHELMDVSGVDGVISWSDRDKIPYTYAMILEVQRYATIVPIPGPRKTNKDIEIKGYVIPRGTAVAANVWGVHHDPAYWDDPHEFKPERFMTEGETKVNSNPPGFMPFSLGKRDCPGRTIAEMEILAYLTEIIKRFEVTAAPGEEVQFKVNYGLMHSLQPQKLCFRKRH